MYLVSSPEVSCTGVESEFLELSQPCSECGSDAAGLSVEMVALISKAMCAADARRHPKPTFSDY